MMKIGIDFDNTIVCYDELFHQIALEKKIISSGIAVNKVAVRDHLRSINQEDEWTKMQGEAYGLRMNDAICYPGVLQFINDAKNQGHQLFIVSHKTKHPFMGPSYDLHASARNWVETHLTINNQALFPLDQVYYELTKEEKIKRIALLNCDVFIDDLPEILSMDGYPAQTKKILFDVENHHANSPYARISHWDQAAQLIF